MTVVPKRNSLQILKKLVPLNLLPDADLEQLLKTAAFKQDRAGSYLFRQGDTDYHNVYLLSGKVALLDNMREVDRVSAGSETARFPLAHQIPRKNSARAVGMVEYVLVDNRKLSELLVRNRDDDYKVADLSSTISDDWMDQLLQSKVFQQIPPSNIQGVIMRMEEVAVRRGEKVVEQGGEGDYFYLINQGRCTVSRQEEGKRKPTELAKLGPGDSFGEEALLSDSPRNSSVTMLTKGTLLRLAKEDFIEFVKRPLAKGVSYAEADAQVAKGAVWLDVRSPKAYAVGHLEHSVSFPLETLRYQAPNLALDQKYVIYCDDGHLSSTAAYLLTDRGFAVSVLEGGLRTVPSDLLVKEKADNTESSAKVISLHPGEEIIDDHGPTAETTELDSLRRNLATANSRIKDLGVKFQSYREKQRKEQAQREAEIKAQKVIIDKNRSRLDELKGKREADRRLIEQLQQESGELNASLKEATERLAQAKANMVDLETRLNVEYGSKRAIAAEGDENKKQLDSYQERLDEAAAERVTLEKEVAELRQGQGEAKQKQDQISLELEQRIKQLFAELNQAQEQNKTLQSELDQVQEKHLTVQSELNQAQENYLTLQTELEKTKGALQVREQAEALTKEKEQILKKMQDLEQNGSAGQSRPRDDDSRTSIEREVFGDDYEDVVSKGLEKAEEESLRQELEDLRKASHNWEQRLKDAEEKCRTLDDALEDRDKELDRVKLDLDEEKAKLVEAEERRQQSEETANQLRELAEQGQTVNEYVDPRLENSPKTLHLDQLVSDPPSRRPMILWALLGAGICFILLEALMIFSDRGELITGMLQDSEAEQFGPDIADRGASEVLAPTIQSVLSANNRKKGLNIKIATKAKKDNEKSGPVWSVLNDVNFGPVMVSLKGGGYIMGSNRNQVSSDNWPAHEVEIKDFAISRTEVTFDDYDRFAQATGRRLPGDQGWGRGKRPVVDVSWDDAVAYTKWLSERTGKRYRLPTEAEWEYAIRSGSDSTYWWGYQMEEGRANCFDCGTEWDRKSTAPVASFPPNNFGLHDMAGNVREWVMDCYFPNYSGAPLDGSAWTERGCKERVARGGAYNKTSDSMRSIWRGHFKPNSHFTFTGFRVVREL